MREELPTMRRFRLDREGAANVIADVWGLALGEPGSWRLDRFGADLASSIENVATVVFSNHRYLVEGPDCEVRVFPIVEPDPHLVPALVCVDNGTGLMQSVGIESLTDVLEDPWGASPETVLNALQRLLDIASGVYAGSVADLAAPLAAPAAPGPGRIPAPEGFSGASAPHPIG